MLTQTAAPARVLEVPTTDDRSIWDTWLSRIHLPALTAADELGLFPALAQAPASAAQVAAMLALRPAGTEALLGVLASLGFLVQRQGRFHLTDAARTYLLPDSPYYYGPLLRFISELPATPAHLRDALRVTAAAPGNEALQQWEAGTLPPALAEPITAMMHSHSLPAATGVARWGDFAGVDRLLDVAGGSGCFCVALALRHPALRCTVLELPAVCPLTERYVAAYGLGNRIDTLAANMFIDPWPTGYDAVFFSNVFHDWDRDSCLHLARRSVEALPAGGRIYLHEMLLTDTQDGPLPAASFSLLMATGARGKQYSAGELDGLLREAGFGAATVTPSYGYYSLVSACKPA